MNIILNIIHILYKIKENPYELTIYVNNNPKKCNQCQAICNYELLEYDKYDGNKHKINVAICPICGRRYIGNNFYNTFSKGNKNTNINFKTDNGF